MSEEHIRGQILTWAQYQSYSVEVIHILTIITWIILQILFIYKFYFCCGRCMSGALRGQLGGHSRGGRRGPQSPAAPTLPSDRQLTNNRMLVISFNIWSFQPCSCQMWPEKKVGNQEWQTTVFHDEWCPGFDACALAGTRQIQCCSSPSASDREKYISLTTMTMLKGGRLVIMSKVKRMED